MKRIFTTICCLLLLLPLSGGLWAVQYPTKPYSSDGLHSSDGFPSVTPARRDNASCLSAGNGIYLHTEHAKLHSYSMGSTSSPTFQHSRATTLSNGTTGGGGSSFIPSTGLHRIGATSPQLIGQTGSKSGTGFELFGAPDETDGEDAKDDEANPDVIPVGNGIWVMLLLLCLYAKCRTIRTGIRPVPTAAGEDDLRTHTANLGQAKALSLQQILSSSYNSIQPTAPAM